MSEGSGTKPRRSTAPLRVAGAAGAIAIGYFGSRVLGWSFWIPLVALAIAWLVLRWTTPKWLAPVLTVIIGQTTWIASSLVILSVTGGLSTELEISIAIEVLIVVALVWWTLKKKSVASLSAIICFELVGLVAILIAIDDHPGQMLTIAMHALLRITGIVAAVYAIVAARRQRALQAA